MTGQQGAPLPRAQDEIAARIERIKSASTDFFGFRREILLGSLDYDHARQFLKGGVTSDEWESDDDPPRLTHEAVLAAAEKYLSFAYGKATDHRGLSAGRSIEKMTEYAWLLGRDDVLAAMAAAPHAHYGVPKLVAFSRGFGLAVPDDPRIVKMAAGEPCRVGCEEGCDA